MVKNLLKEDKVISGLDAIPTKSSGTPHLTMKLYAAGILVFWFLIAFLFIYFKLNENSQYTFTGIYGSRFHKWVGYDSALYLDMIHQSKEGAWLFENRFSPERGTPLYLNSIWLLLGKIAKLFHLAPLTIFYIFKFAAVPFFIFSLGTLLREILKKRSTRRLAFFVILFCGGIGWIFGILGHWIPAMKPLFTEGRCPETSIFLCLLVSPHITTAMGLVLLIMTGFIKAHLCSRTTMWLTPLLMLVLSTFHPYDTLMLYMVGAGYITASWIQSGKPNKRLIQLYALSLALSAPILAYHRWALLNGPDLQGLRYQNSFPPESTINYGTAILPLGLFALQQLIVRLTRFKASSEGHLLTVTWSLMLPVMVYAYPLIPFAWKLGVAMQIPIFILAVEWLERRLELLRSDRNIGFSDKTLFRLRLVTTLPVVIALCSSPVTVAAIMRAGSGHSVPYYSDSACIQAMKWLRDRKDGDTVISARTNGMHLPLIADKRPFMGHAVQTVNYPAKKRFAISLFNNGKLLDWQLKTLQKHGVDWIMYGKHEQKWWPKLRSSKNVRLVYDRSGVRIYRLVYD